MMTLGRKNSWSFRVKSRRGRDAYVLGCIAPSWCAAMSKVVSRVNFCCKWNFEIVAGRRRPCEKLSHLTTERTQVEDAHKYCQEYPTMLSLSSTCTAAEYQSNEIWVS